MWYYRSYFLDLTMALGDFQVEGCPLLLKNICLGGYVVFNDIDFDGGEGNICRQCFDKL